VHVILKGPGIWINMAWSYRLKVRWSVINLTFVNHKWKIFSAFRLKTTLLFVKIVEKQNNMVAFYDIAKQFVPGANVGNMLFVLLIVLTGILKPAGAIMV
jgi:hypothetical protein